MYAAGKNLVTANALSGALQTDILCSDWILNDVVERHVDAVVQTLPASNLKLEQIRRAPVDDDL